MHRVEEHKHNKYIRIEIKWKNSECGIGRHTYQIFVIKKSIMPWKRYCQKHTFTDDLLFTW